MRKPFAVAAVLLAALLPATYAAPAPAVDARACNALRYFPAVSPAGVETWLQEQYGEPAERAGELVSVALRAGCR